MDVTVINAQRATPVSATYVATVARFAIRKIGIHRKGILAISCISSQNMRGINRTFLGHNRATDVVSFRYDGEPIIGEILVCPSVARRYARKQNIPYKEELARYIIHGILHWVGFRDATLRAQKRMRAAEDRLLKECMNGVEKPLSGSG